MSGCSHPRGRIIEKLQSITINNGDDKTTPLRWDKNNDYIYGNNTIAQKSTSNVRSDPDEWSHSWAVSKPIKTTKKDNQCR